MKEHLVSHRILPFVVSLLAVAAVAAAGDTPTGSLEGSVVTSDGQALPGVAVTLHGPAGDRRLTTRPDGSFAAAGLPAGPYILSVDVPGLELRGPSTARVESGASRLDLVLAPAPVTERVVVSATRGEATLSSIGVVADVLDRDAIDDRAAPSLLPLLQEVPGVSTARAGQTGQQGSAFVRGGESRYARVLVDGVPVNQPGGASTSAPPCRSSWSESRSCAGRRAASTGRTPWPASSASRRGGRGQATAPRCGAKPRAAASTGGAGSAGRPAPAAASTGTPACSG